MSNYLLAALLGVVEGVTEFLPVSSTAHLRLVELWLGMNLDDPFWKMFSVVIQLGAVLCLPIYFFKQIARFIATFPNGPRGDRTIWTHPLTLTMIAFFVTAGPAYLLKKLISANLEKPYVWGSALFLGGVIMWAVDYLWGGREKKYRKELALGPTDEVPPLTSRMDGMSLMQSIWIGACQVLSAVFPGTSRSMTTIAAGQIGGLTRATALEFSFFLSIPTMFAATIFDFRKAVMPVDPKDAVHMTGEYWVVLAIGFIVSFFVAWLVVAWFMSWVRRRGFTPFAIYRIILGLAVMIMARHLVDKPAPGPADANATPAAQVQMNVHSPAMGAQS